MRHDETRRVGDSNSPEAIEADIKQTRAQMSAKIDTIQDRLDPERLKVQAQDAAKDILHDAQDSARQLINEAGNNLSVYVEDSVHSMTEYVREHSDEIGHSMLRTVKKNPVPVALIGLGIGWMLMRGSGNDQSEWDSGHINRRRYSDHDTWEDEMLRGRNRGSRIYTPNDMYDESDFGDQDKDRSRNYSSGFTNTGRSQSNGGLGGNKQSMGGRDSLSRGDSYDRNRHTQGTSGVGERLQDMGERAQDMGEDAIDRVKESGEEITNRAQEMGENLKNRVEETGAKVAHQTQEFTDRIRATGEDIADSTQEFTHRMREQGEDVVERAQEMGHQVHHALEENPILFGLVAFASGAALAMLLPQSRTENRMVGRYRDEFVESAREVGENALQHAQNVYEEVRPELEESFQRVTSELRDVGESAMGDIREVANTAKESSKPEVEAVLREATGSERKADKDEKPSTTGIFPSGTTAAGATAPGMAKSDSGHEQILKGRWNQLKGEIKQKWGKLTDDDITRIDGNYDKLIGRMQERYSYSKEQAQREASQFLTSKGSLAWHK